GISTTRLPAMAALRMRVSMSLIGSFIALILMFLFSLLPVLPGRLGHAGNVACQRQLTEADAAHAELAHIGVRTAATAAAVVRTDLELGGPLLLFNHRTFGHSSLSCALFAALTYEKAFRGPAAARGRPRRPWRWSRK